MDQRTAAGHNRLMEHRIALDEIGVTLRVIEEGAGPALLFLHGNPDDAQEWSPVIARLKSSFRCIAPDLPGYGQSSVPPPSYDFSLEAQLRFVDALVAKLGLTRLSLVVHDIGGVMGIAWAAANLARVERLFILNTVAFKGFRWFAIARAWGKPGWVASLRMAILTPWLFKLVFGRDSPQLPKRELERIGNAFPRNRVAKRSSLRQFPKMTAPDFFDGYEAMLASITKSIPTTVVWGTNDPYVPDRYAEEFGSAEVVKLDGVGHWVALVTPDRLAEEIRRRAPATGASWSASR
jgi:pimeloyl-ACP methyl ester carboxylesterase